MTVRTHAGYKVRSSDGTKRPGGQYDTEEEARKRLAQVEHFRAIDAAHERQRKRS